MPSKIVFASPSTNNLTLCADFYAPKADSLSIDHNHESKVGNSGPYAPQNHLFIGRAIFSSTCFSQLYGVVTSPVMNSNLKLIGQVSFQYMVACPFEHPKNCLQYLWALPPGN